MESLTPLERMRESAFKAFNYKYGPLRWTELHDAPKNATWVQSKEWQNFVYFRDLAKSTCK